MAAESKTYGVAWCKGGSPEDGGWAFDDGDAVNGYTMAYETPTRQQAQRAGVPDTVLDLFEADGGEYDSGGGLFDWLQSRSDLFRS